MLRFVRYGVVVLACVGMLMPRAAWAAGQRPAGNEQRVVDVALDAGGLFQGQVVDPDNVATVACEVVLLRNGQEVARTTTDREGRFSVSGLRGGVYQVMAGGGGGVYRLWAPGTAPPSAGSSALVIAGDVVRGQWASGHMIHLITNPWVVSGAVATGAGLALCLDKGGSS
jgi:hypothetical protein